MGSFNVSCGLSGLPIEQGDKVGLVLLKTSLSGEAADTILVYPEALYVPAVPIIYGEYKSGSLDNIVYNNTVRYFESKHNKSMKKLLNLFDTEKGDNLELGSFYYMFFLEKFFDKLAPLASLEASWKKPDRFVGEAQVLLDAYRVNVNGKKDNADFAKTFRAKHKALKAFEFSELPVQDEKFWLNYQNDEGVTDFVNLLTLQALLSHLNRIYIPSRYVTEEGCSNEFNDAFFNLQGEILAERRKAVENS